MGKSIHAKRLALDVAERSSSMCGHCSLLCVVCVVWMILSKDACNDPVGTKDNRADNSAEVMRCEAKLSTNLSANW